MGEGAEHCVTDRQLSKQAQLAVMYNPNARNGIIKKIRFLPLGSMSSWADADMAPVWDYIERLRP